MNPQTTHSLTEILAQAPCFQHLTSKMSDLNRLRQSLMTLAPNMILQNCRIGNFEDGRLTLIVPSPALANKLRYLSPELMAQLQPQEPWQNLKTIKVLVCADEDGYSSTRPSLPARKGSLSTQTAALLKSTANAIPHLALKQALLALSKGAGLDPSA